MIPDCMKKCPGCGTVQHKTRFNKNASRKDGLQDYCGRCSSSIQNKFRRANREASRKYDRVLYRRHREARLMKSKAWRSNNPIKERAHAETRRAKARGDIVVPDACDRCGCTEPRLEAHHADYLKPLEVDFLCGSCHVSWHNKHGEGLNG